jgi:hypothetical protein
MNALRRWWPDVLVVVGVAWLSFACSAYGGDGDIDGQLDEGGGDVSGDILIGYSDTDRVSIAGAATLITIGVLAKINRREPIRIGTAPTSLSDEPSRDDVPKAL